MIIKYIHLRNQSQIFIKIKEGVASLLVKVRKAVIPAAGLGTRFLPATKAIAKEMLPIVDKPTIQFIVEEAIASGIEDIIVITGKGKRPIEDHFDANFELEYNLKKNGKNELLALVEETTEIRLHFIRQKRPNGLGDAVYQARSFIADEPFVVMLGDDIMVDEVPLTKQLIDNYESTKASTIAVIPVPNEDTSKYGIIEPIGEMSDGIYGVQSFVEKPSPEDAPSNLAIVGRYLLKSEIFSILKHQEVGRGGEIQLTDAIDTLNKTQRVFALEFKGKRYDVGNKLGMLEANIEYGLKHPELEGQLIEYLKEVVERY